ncbi:MAG: NAD-dependent epimerase/dehydratase family protein [Proteobacteria bacterium]|nr:NAD-dependent epimerase/dehydratase family protein [Pseudomonadota bacterium]
MKADSTRRVLVTGAGGFIGRHVLSELSRHSVDVVALVRDTGNTNLAALGSEIFQLDLQNPPDNAFDLLGRPDVLIHLAWGGLPNYHSLHHFEQELPMQYHFLSGLIRAGLPALVVSGTCLEYGMQSGQLTEEMETRPNNPYGYAKDALRRQLEYLRATQPFALTWARLFYLYGEGQAENSLWPQLKLSVRRGDNTFNMSGGEQLRDYLHVTDVAKYIVMMALNGADIGVVNICSGKPISVRSLVEGWIKENGWKINLNLGYYTYPDYEPMGFWGDRRKLDRFLNDIMDSE